MKLTAEFKPQAVNVNVNPQTVALGFGTPVTRDCVEREPYTGDYTVTPQAHEDVVLETNGKRMTDDVTVFRVPYFETSNVYGNTVFIASEVN